MRVILDTNILVSMALVKRGRLEPLWHAWQQGRFEVLTSAILITEVRDVLSRPKLAKYVDQASARALLSALQTLTLHVDLAEPFPDFEDPKDRFLLAMARDARADVLVTGDNALLSLQVFGDTLIVTAADLIQALSA